LVAKIGVLLCYPHQKTPKLVRYLATCTKKRQNWCGTLLLAPKNAKSGAVLCYSHQKKPKLVLHIVALLISDKNKDNYECHV
jgi:hypothetical protein